jgi:hypothetical protein
VVVISSNLLSLSFSGLLAVLRSEDVCLLKFF